MENKSVFVENKLLNILYDEPSLITIIKSAYVTEDIWRFCIDREPSLFKDVKYPSYELALFAIKLDGYNLKYVKEKFPQIKITQELAFWAVKSCPHAIKYVPKKICNRGIIELAVKEDNSLLEDYEDYLEDEFIINIISSNPQALQYLHRLTENIICELLENNPNYITFINNPSEKMLKTVEDSNPTIYKLYKASLT